MNYLPESLYSAGVTAVRRLGVRFPWSEWFNSPGEGGITKGEVYVSLESWAPNSPCPRTEAIRPRLSCLHGLCYAFPESRVVFLASSRRTSASSAHHPQHAQLLQGYFRGSECTDKSLLISFSCNYFFHLFFLPLLRQNVTV